MIDHIIQARRLKDEKRALEAQIVKLQESLVLKQLQINRTNAYWKKILHDLKTKSG